MTCGDCGHSAVYHPERRRHVPQGWVLCFRADPPVPVLAASEACPQAAKMLDLTGDIRADGKPHIVRAKGEQG